MSHALLLWQFVHVFQCFIRLKRYSAMLSFASVSASLYDASSRFDLHNSAAAVSSLIDSITRSVDAIK
jgi:hypothetical protein